MGDYRKLDIWRRAHRLTLSVYRATTTLPPAEQYGLVSQMRRAAFSIPMNVAEGCGRSSDSELRRFLKIALGSATELEYQVLLSHELEYFDHGMVAELQEELDHMKRMLARLVRRVTVDSARSQSAAPDQPRRQRTLHSGQRIADSG